MIRVLLVEDSDAVVGQVRGWLDSCSPECELVVATNRDDAVAHLSQDADFDLIICDLNIPPRPGSVDGREEYGMAVHEQARLAHRGTPCLFFTGHADDIDTHDQLSAGGVEDVYGTGALEPMVRLVRKLYAERAGDYIRTMAAEVAQLDGIELEIADLDLDEFDQRAIRVFVRRHLGVRAELQPLGGLSGAKTFRLSAFDADGARRALAFGKVSTRAAVEDEERRFQQFVSVHLDPTYVPVLAGHVLAGAGRRAAVFYSFADRFDRSLFDVLERDERAAVDVLAALRQATEPWHDTGMSGHVSVGDLRRRGVDDGVLEGLTDALDGLAQRRVEDYSTVAAVGPQHGDLHGKNVLVDANGRVLLIDFGDVERRPLGFDPVILELSLLFHPDRPHTATIEPDACAQWTDVDVFANATPCPHFVRACRTWAMAVTGEDVVLGLAYAHSMRQLKYRDTDKAAAVAIAKACAGRLIDLALE